METRIGAMFERGDERVLIPPYEILRAGGCETGGTDALSVSVGFRRAACSRAREIDPLEETKMPA